MKKPVTERALAQRINRKLAKDGQKLRKSRSGGELSNLGEYYIVDILKNVVTAWNVEIEVLGREINAFAEWEVLEDSSEAEIQTIGA